MAEKKNKTAIAKAEKNITDVVLNKVSGFAHSGELVLPQDYSAENALKAAWLALQTVEDKNHNKALNICSQPSIANSLLDMVVQGLNPVKKQCYFVVYGKELTLMRSYMGTVAVAKRFSDVEDVRAQVVYEGDEFEYEIDPITANISITKHRQNLDNVDIHKIKAVYAVITKSDGTHYVELMTMAQVRAAWNQGATKGGSPAHKNFTEEMAKKTVINRACKLFVNTSGDNAVLVGAFNRVTENEYRRHEDQEVIDVDDSEIKELGEAAERSIFGVENNETEKNEENIEDKAKDIKDEPEDEIKTPFDKPEQVRMEESCNE